MFRKHKKQKKSEHLSFDEILLDASNLPSFNTKRMEGRFELPLSSIGMYAVFGIFLIIALVFLWRLFTLQVIEGANFATQSEENRLNEALVVAERGIIRDRHDELVAWNEIDHTGQYAFPVRAYTDRDGLGQLIGYVSYPQKDRAGFYYRTEYEGIAGIEETFDETLEGERGKRLVEVNALGEVISEHVVDDPVGGDDVQLSVDAELSEVMHNMIASSTKRLDFRSGAGAIMDVQTGELIAMTSYPSYDPEVLSDGDDVKQIEAYNEDERFPFLNKLIGGAYTPGSIVKPFVAYAALAEDVIDPETVIVSNGSITVPNPYNPGNPSVFNDWRAHGAMTMRDAIAFSSNVYFYTIGGGFKDQEGVGITKLAEYFDRFDIGETTGLALSGEIDGVVPDPQWKEEVFDDDWRLGDTYFTAIGQYGFLTTPLSMLRAYGAIANGGSLLTPKLTLGATPEANTIDLNPDDLAVIREGMRRTVIQDGGTARALERDDVAIAAKSGTAELDGANRFVNSWIAGYFPYEEPKYAFILFMERGPYENTLGAGRVMSWVFDWMSVHRPEYLGIEEGETDA